jgi:hypothetical protein
MTAGRENPMKTAPPSLFHVKNVFASITNVLIRKVIINLVGLFPQRKGKTKMNEGGTKCTERTSEARATLSSAETKWL